MPLWPLDSLAKNTAKRVINLFGISLGFRVVLQLLIDTPVEGDHDDVRNRRATSDGHDLSQFPFSSNTSFHLEIHLSDPVSDHTDNVGGLRISLGVWALEPEE